MEGHCPFQDNILAPGLLFLGCTKENVWGTRRQWGKSKLNYSQKKLMRQMTLWKLSHLCLNPSLSYLAFLRAFKSHCSPWLTGTPAFMLSVLLTAILLLLPAGLKEGILCQAFWGFIHCPIQCLLWQTNQLHSLHISSPFACHCLLGCFSSSL